MTLKIGSLGDISLMKKFILIMLPVLIIVVQTDLIELIEYDNYVKKQSVLLWQLIEFAFVSYLYYLSFGFDIGNYM